MIKSEIRSTVLNSVKRYDATAKFHPRVTDAECEFVLHQMLGEVFRMSPHSLQRYTKGYGYTVALAVSTEASTGIYYTTLPENILVLPDKASGVRRVATPTQTSIKFYPMDQREWDLVAYGSYANTVKDQVGYIVTPTRVEFYGMTGAVQTSGVRMDLLIPFSKYADTDVVLYPEHIIEEEGKSKGFIDRVVDRLLAKPQTVDLSDQNKDKEE